VATKQLGEAIRSIRTRVLQREADALSDGQLLECFLSRRDEAAFATLVGRHGPMVWGVCRRILRSHQDAEDAFQATFLVLIRKASSIVPKEMVANWLYGVAHQTSLRARDKAISRNRREKQIAHLPECESPTAACGALEQMIDEELSRLPDKYRMVVVLCDLEGKTRREAAEQLGVPEGTVAGRLARARAMLAKRLARHGLMPTAGLLAAVLSQGSARSAAMPTVASQGVISGVVSARAAALAAGVLNMMFVTKLKWAVSVALCLAILGAGASLAGIAGGQIGKDTEVPELAVKPQTKPEEPGIAAAKDRQDKEKPAPLPERIPLAEAEKRVRAFVLKENPRMAPTVKCPLKELTTDDVWKRLKVQVFQVTDDVQVCETFVLTREKVHRIGKGIGGHGVVSLCVADLNKDGRLELVYSYSWGSGMHRSHVAVFDCQAKAPKEYIAPQTYLHHQEDLKVKRDDDQTVRVFSGKTEVGRMVFEGKEGEWSVRLDLAKDLDADTKDLFRTMKNK
jgi:RNA polymerase sigma factor (sigma-70 family)